MTTIRFWRKTIPILLTASVFCSACANTSNRDSFSIAGMLAGAATGAAIGSSGGSQYAGIAMIGGGIIGGLAGFMLGTRLDEAEKEKAGLAAKNAAASNQRIYWQSGTRSHEISGYAESIKDSATPLQPVSLAPPVPAQRLNVEEQPDIHSFSAEEICNGATYFGKWEKRQLWLGHVNEAKRRGLGCSIVDSAAPQKSNSAPTISPAPFMAFPVGPTLRSSPTSVGVPTTNNCRHVKEVLIVRGQETSGESTYCNSGQGWTRAG